MALNRLKTVGTASGNEATARADQRGNPTPIETDQGKHQRANQPIEGMRAAGR